MWFLRQQHILFLSPALLKVKQLAMHSMQDCQHDTIQKDFAGSECQCACILKRGYGAMEPTSDRQKGNFDGSEDQITTAQIQ